MRENKEMGKANLVLLILTVFIMQSCSESYDTEEWFEIKKSEVLRFCKHKPDSVLSVISRDSSLRTISHYYDGEIIYERSYNLSYENIGIESFYFPSNDLELRREICENESVGFEGLFVNDKAHGLSKWWDCKGQLRRVGYRFEGSKVGLWREYIENGKVEIEEDYGSN